MKLKREKLKKRRILLKRLIIATFCLQLTLGAILQFTVFDHFVFQNEMLVFIFLINMVMLAIRMVIIDNYLVPMHDPGITVWWLCCIKFG